MSICVLVQILVKIGNFLILKKVWKKTKEKKDNKGEKKERKKKG
jgi:hypothetical protein